jgi:CheY-like chemotaxis protein
VRHLYGEGLKPLKSDSRQVGEKPDPIATSGKLKSLRVKPLVLIVEDHPDIAGLLRQIVEIQGAQTLVAYSGRDALAILYSDPPSAVVLDAGLPDISGIEVLRCIRDDPKLNAIPVVLYTAGIDPETRQEALNLGDEAIVLKTDLFDMMDTTEAFVKKVSLDNE